MNTYQALEVHAYREDHIAYLLKTPSQPGQRAEWDPTGLRGMYRLLDPETDEMRGWVISRADLPSWAEVQAAIPEVSEQDWRQLVTEWDTQSP